MALAREMREAGRSFLDHIDDEQRRAAVFAFDDDAERHDWHYVRPSRNGLSVARADGGPLTGGAGGGGDRR